MFSSKANAALARLKEIEEKYKMKREKQKWTHKENTDSSISSVSIIPSENPSAELKKSPRNILKLKLDIKIPDTRIEDRTEETKLSSEKKKSTSDKMSPEPFEDEADLDVTMPSKDKSPRSTGKQESLISDVTSIQENSSIESVLDDSMISSKSLSRSKTSRGNFSTASNKSSRREERTKVAGKYEKGKESDKLSEISRGKASSGNSSIIKQSRLPGKSNEKSAFKARSGLRSEERSIEEKVAIKIPNATSLDTNLDRSRSLRDDSVIEESVGTVDGSEIISELSYTKTGITTKNYNNSIKNSKYSAADNAVVVSSSSKQLATESGYANDTFEDISSSTLRSQSQHEKIMDGSRKIDLAESSTKKIQMALLEQHKYQQNNKTIRNEHVTLKPNTEVNLEPPNYVNTNSDNAIVSLIKSPKLVSSKKPYQEYQPESIKRNNSNVTNFDKNISDSSESLTRIGDVTNTDEKKNSPEIKTTSVRQESSRKEHGKASNKIRERAMINITEPPVAEDIIESSSSEEKETEKENVFEESSNQHISQNAEEVLRKLHKDAYDALVKRHTSSKNAKKTSQKSSKSKTESENKDVMKGKKEMSKEENESHCSLEENEMHNRNDLKSSNQKKKKIIKVTKSAQVHNTGNHKEEKTSRFDEKQMHGLRKRIVKLRLQQEREDLQKYLQELKNSRLESGCTQGYFYPLEFPKIAEFTQSDAMNLESKLDDQHIMLRERVSAIKRCLKDQYILYRDYCSMAQAINVHYVPTTLQDAKKTIRELQKMTITSR
ncbi:hypothetical protein EAG_13075 [Camponotus floridanus]|uniref:Uncharacterized protein n=1 Tax=Camponotus floridanus TaxID=104421 RepID=E1ZZT1_CAMFO|nr:myb-like protein X [Camponotus floridanus]EFN73304.1 hypothetical protein EAG_13075 [Camponotus floridanus]